MLVYVREIHDCRYGYPFVMVLLILIILLFFSVLSYWYTRSAVHPAFITSTLWLILILVYSLIPHGLYPLSAKFYYAIALWCIPFCSCALIFSKFRFAVPAYFTYSCPNIKLFNKIGPILLVTNALLIVAFNTLAADYGTNIVSRLRNVFMYSPEEVPRQISLLMYLSVFGIVTVITYMYTPVTRTIKYKLLTFSSLIILMCLGNKGGIAGPAFAVLFMQYFYGKLNWKKIVVFLLIVIGLMTAMVLIRADAGGVTLADYIIIYTLSPLPAFDMLLNHDLTVLPATVGTATFGSFFKVLHALGLDASVVPFVPPDWAYVPLPTNVFTHMYSFYLDFGYGGIMAFAIFFGSAWGILYNLMKRHIRLFVTVYALFFHSLLLSFFADFVFTFMSLSIQYLFIVHLLYLRFKFRPA